MTNTLRIIKRIAALGPIGSWLRLHAHVKKRIYSYQTKQLALKNVAHTSWHTLQTNLHAASAKHYIRQIFSQPLWHNFLSHQLFKKYAAHHTQDYLKQAEALLHNQFTLFGYTVELPTTDIPWHTDITIEARKKSGQNIVGNYLTKKLTTMFYNTITIPNIPTTHATDYVSDIKVPWELSRMQHLFIMGKAYAHYQAHSETATAKLYAEWVRNHLVDWTTNNPYLLGINWLCPMEVAIRALNIIWGLYFFAHDANMDEAWWQSILCSLYDHMHYLENNWETSDKPNNHLLADLIGYHYLTILFQPAWPNKPMIERTCTQFVIQLKKQVDADGINYEGSTAYHQLVTEMVLHETLLSTFYKTAESEELSILLKKMLQFLENCTQENGQLIAIGDNDSGKILTGLTIESCKKKTLQAYPQAGITIVRSKVWHVSFRHNTFNKIQPSGHFHQDALAVTISNNAIPLIIDAGSGYYTSNPAIRNTLRSWESHNTFYCAKSSTLTKNLDLFQLPRPSAASITSIIKQENELITLQAWHNDDSCKNKKFYRTVRITPVSITLEDSVHSNQTPTNPCSWQFILHPNIKAQQLGDLSWLLCYQTMPVCSLTSSLPLSIRQAWYSPHYGSIEKTTALFCTQTVQNKQIFYTTFTSY